MNEEATRYPLAHRRLRGGPMSTEDTVDIVVVDLLGDNNLVAVPVLARCGSLVAHTPHPSDNEPLGRVNVTHGPSGLKIATRSSLEAAVALMESLAEFPWGDLDVRFNRKGEPRIANRRAHKDWLARAKAIARPEDVEQTS